MNVLQIVPRLDLGGVETGVLDFALYLKEKGHKPVVISSGGKLLEDLAKAGIKHYSLRVDKKSLFSIISCIGKVRDIILKEKIDIIHCRSRIPAVIGYFACWNTPAKFITTCHGYYSKNIFGRFMALGEAVICPSRVIARHMAEDFGADKNKITVIPRGINLGRFTFVPPERKDFSNIRVCFIGRISPVKGIEYFIDAAAEVLKHSSDFEFLICGRAESKHKDYEEFLERKARRLGLGEKLKFLGRVNSAAVLKTAHILVFPSLVRESFGRVIVEAQASGVVVISSALGAPLDIIKDNETGFFAQPKDFMEISRLILKLSQDRGLYSKTAYSARRDVEEKYPLSLMAEKTIQIYKQVLAKVKIGIIKLSALGDVVLAVPSLQAVRKKYPEADIFAVVEKRYADVFHLIPQVSRVVAVNKKGWLGAVKTAGILRKLNLDILIDLQNNRFSHLVCKLSFPKHSIGYNRRLGFLLDTRIDYPSETKGPLASQQKLLEVLGISLSGFFPPFLKLDSEIPGLFSEILGSKQELWIGINLKASSKWQTKGLSRKFILAAVRCLLDLNSSLKIILLGDTQTAGFAVQIKEEAGFPNIINLCGKTTVSDLIKIIGALDLLITPDSAPLHIAQIMGVKALAFFGPTDPFKHISFFNSVFILQKKGLKCLGCYKNKCRDLFCQEIPEFEICGLINSLLS